MSRPDILTEAAPAKVNLYLHVTGKRPNGYHELDSLVVFAGAADELRAEPAEALSLVFRGPFGAPLAAEADNLVLRAARALLAAAGHESLVRLTLEKNLPVASGIGGGSADAAACLRLLGRLWNVTAPPELALSLGADVPVCLAGVAARMSGVGECLTPAPRLPACGMVLVNPGVALGTADVFRARVGGFSAVAALPEAWPDARSMTDDLVRLGNDLEVPAIGLCPVIGDVLAALRAAPGCLLARMSGSGATCFGLFADPDGAARVARALRRPGWWSWGGAIRRP
ncbi:MAG: 4-(cytidine 5'-diphospho)-2-C-methyl-D-erythritol kinase [Alphaproteobacteria bacterium]|nr:4-(cytidine 5'-diphospho)-2-C-methyl-D-erythritol kinase [Alphaproteobacteria bacterium]